MGRGPELGRAGGQHGKEGSCWLGSLCTSICAAALMEDPVSYHWAEGSVRGGEVVAEPGGWQAG